MSAPPSLKRVPTEGLEDMPEPFLDVFLPLLNRFLTDTTNLLTGNVSAENLAAEEREVTFTTSGSGPYVDAAPFPLSVTPQTIKKPKNFVVTSVKTNGTLVGGVFAWCELDAKGNIKIRYVSGLDTATTYTLRLRFD